MSSNFVDFYQFKEFIYALIPYKSISDIGVASKTGIKQWKEGFTCEDFEYMGYPLDYKYFINGDSIPTKMQILELKQYVKGDNSFLDNCNPHFFYVAVANSMQYSEWEEYLKKNSFTYVDQDEAGGWYPYMIYYFPIEKMNRYCKNTNDNYEANLFAADIKNYKGKSTYTLSVAGYDKNGISNYGKIFTNETTSIDKLEDLLYYFKNAKIYCISYTRSESTTNDEGYMHFSLEVFVSTTLLNKLPGTSNQFF